MNIRFASSGALLALLLSPAAAQTGLRTVQIASGFTRPVDIQTPKGDRSRLFVVEQTGRIKIVKNGQVLATPFLNLSNRVACCSERGLLGLAFHPNYAQNGYFFVNYTASSPFGATVVERYTVSANPDVANPASHKLVFGPLNLGVPRDEDDGQRSNRLLECGDEFGAAEPRHHDVGDDRVEAGA